MAWRGNAVLWRWRVVALFRGREHGLTIHQQHGGGVVAEGVQTQHDHRVHAPEGAPCAEPRWVWPTTDGIGMVRPRDGGVPMEAPWPPAPS